MGTNETPVDTIAQSSDENNNTAPDTTATEINPTERTPAEALKDRVTNDILETLRGGFGHRAVAIELEAAPNKQEYAGKLLSLHANPFRGLHLTKVPVERDSKDFFGIPDIVPSKTDVLVVSCIDLLGEEPHKVLREICSSLGTDLDDELSKGTHGVGNKGIAAIQLGAGIYITIPVESVYTYNKETRLGTFETTAAFSAARAVVQMDVNDEKDKPVPYGRNLIASVVS